MNAIGDEAEDLLRRPTAYDAYGFASAEMNCTSELHVAVVQGWGVVPSRPSNLRAEPLVPFVGLRNTCTQYCVRNPTIQYYCVQSSK